MSTNMAPDQGDPRHLPSELILLILSFLKPEHPKTLQSQYFILTLVSRQWNRTVTPFLYAHPQITGKNFESFVNTIAPSLSASRGRPKTDLGSLVLHLDLYRLQYHSVRSLTARLLGRVKENLEVFVAPEISFGESALTPLSKCQRLHTLDLSLVAGHLSVPSLSQTFAKLTAVTSLSLSRSMSRDINNNCHLPPNLIHLQTSGNPPHTSTSNPLTGDTPAIQWPASLTTLTIVGCEGLSPFSQRDYYRLTKLYLVDCFNNPRGDFMRELLSQLPNLILLSAPGQTFRGPFFDSFSGLDKPHPLCTLEISRSLTILAARYFPINTFEIALQGNMANLRSVRIHNSQAAGASNGDGPLSEMVNKIDELFDQFVFDGGIARLTELKAKRDGPERKSPIVRAHRSGSIRDDDDAGVPSEFSDDEDDDMLDDGEVSDSLNLGGGRVINLLSDDGSSNSDDDDDDNNESNPGRRRYLQRGGRGIFPGSPHTSLWCDVGNDNVGPNGNVNDIQDDMDEDTDIGGFSEDSDLDSSLKAEDWQEFVVAREKEEPKEPKLTVEELGELEKLEVMEPMGVVWYD